MSFHRWSLARPIGDERKLVVARTARARRRRQSLIGWIGGLTTIAIPLAMLWLIGALWEDDAERLGLILAVIGGLVLLLIVMTIVSHQHWRCPVCGGRLETGRLLGPACRRICDRCGARLVVDWDECPTDPDDEFPVHRYAEIERR